MNAIIHCHSKHSHDSNCNPKHIFNFCIEKNISMIILSDHDNVRGSIELANLVKLNRANIIAPPAAEYKTEYGDVILVGLPYTIKNPSFNNLIEISKKNNCRLLLPHPFHDHKNIQYLAENVDFIEIFNSRCNTIDNQKAKDLAKLFSKKTYASPDAHLISEYNNCIVKYDNYLNDDWRDILDLNWEFCSSRNAKSYNIYRSSLIKSIKIHSPTLLIKSLIRLATLGYRFKKNK
jgi:predicted metal-dependent phosphoesterase TrpH